MFITSISSTFASISRPEYCVSKAGLSMVAQLFAVRLAEQGIRVYEVRPGLIETAMTQPVREPVRQEDRRRHHADPAVGNTRRRRPCRRRRSPSGAFPYSTGSIFDVDGGLSLRIL